MRQRTRFDTCSAGQDAPVLQTRGPGWCRPPADHDPGSAVFLSLRRSAVSDRRIDVLDLEIDLKELLADPSQRFAQRSYEMILATPITTCRNQTGRPCPPCPSRA